MITSEIKNSLKQAISNLKVAENELNRPVADVVTLSLCLTARQSIYSLLQVFLLSKDTKFGTGKSLDFLFNQCKTIDKQFDSINMSKILCNDLNQKECEKEYCLSAHKVTDCISVANQIKFLVLNKLKLTENELI